MPKLTRLSIAKADIEAAFEAGPVVLRAADIQRYLDEKREFWRLAQNTNLKRFIDFLKTRSNLREKAFDFPHRKIIGYAWGAVPDHIALHHILRDGYFSHYTAISINGLTEQVPKTFYYTSERRGYISGYKDPKKIYSQESIDKAFLGKPRISSNECQVGEYRYIHLAGSYQASAGIIAKEVHLGDAGKYTIKTTSIERTLIDAVTRPFYCGGVGEVLKAFLLAKDIGVSINRLSALLRELDFGYPYHQAIGYYLEKSGYRGSLIDIFKKMPMERNFYIAYELAEPEYNRDWKLFIPKGF